MHNRLRLRALVMLAVGGLLGYVAATGPWSISPAALAQQPITRSGDKEFVGALDRTVLPIAEPKPAPITALDARNAKAPPRFEVKVPAGAPNVLIVLIDDMGFGQSSAFGGPVQMPTLEKLATGGL